MARSYASGLVWGIVAVGAGFVVISQLAPPPQGAHAPKEVAAAGGAEGASGTPESQPDSAPPPATSPEAAPEAAMPQTPAAGTSAGETAVPEPAAPDAAQTAPLPSEPQAGAAAPPVSQSDAQPTAQPDPAASQPAPQPQAEAPAPVANGADSGAAALPAASDTVPSANSDAGAMAALPPLPETPAAVEAPPALSALDDALTAPGPDQKPASPPQPVPEPPGAKDALLQPSQGAGLTEPSRLPQIAPPLTPSEEAMLAPEPALVPALVPTPQPAPETAGLPAPAETPAPVAEPAPSDAAPAAPGPVAPRVFTPDQPQMPGVPAGSGLAKQEPAPSLLKPVQPIGSVPGVATNTLPHVGDAPKSESDVAAQGGEDQPLRKYARRFDGAQGKPLFAILLQDIGAAGMDRAELAKLPFPVTFVVDPLAQDAREAEDIYRAAGQEVLMLANGIPTGATASDVEQTFQTLQDILPETVGVIDEATLGFQDNRALSGLVLPVIADQGRGLVTYDRGLNAADQIARRDGLPAAVIFRKLDGAGESQPIMRRYLDRAAFKAAQEGAVVVIGDTRPETVAAILQWTIEGKASSVALAPITALMAHK